MNRPNRHLARLSRPGWVFVLVWVVLGLSPVFSWAKEEQPTLDELLNIRPPADSQAPTLDTEHAPGDLAAPDTDQEGLDHPPQSNPDGQPPDLFDQTVQEMRRAADRLGQRFDAGIETQRVQESILDKLDQIIAAAKQQQSGGSSGGSDGSAQQQDVGSAQNAGAQQSMAGAVSSGMGGGGGGGGAGQVSPDTSAGPMQTHRSQWGSLPPRLRDELQQGFNEPFSSVYSELTGEYYRRLAQESR